MEMPMRRDLILTLDYADAMLLSSMLQHEIDSCDSNDKIRILLPPCALDVKMYRG